MEKIKLIDNELVFARNSEGNYGIEALKTNAVSIIKTWNNFQDRRESGDRLTWFERVQTSLDVAQTGTTLQKSFSDLVDELQDLDEEEAMELAQHVADTLNIDYTAAFSLIAEVVVKSINIVIDGIEIYNKIIKLRK